MRIASEFSAAKETCLLNALNGSMTPLTAQWGNYAPQSVDFPPPTPTPASFLYNSQSPTSGVAPSRYHTAPVGTIGTPSGYETTVTGYTRTLLLVRNKAYSPKYKQGGTPDALFGLDNRSLS
jgi:hypothetical protein